MMGSTIEAAGQEMEKFGPKDAPEWRPKYKMSQLLDPEFRLPTEETENDRLDSMFSGGRIKGGLIYDEVG